MSEDEKIEQVAKQCRVVVHLAKALIEVYETQAELFEARIPAHLPLADMLGNRTAYLMEELGNHLDGIDAVDESDAWTDEVYHAAHRMFPLPPKTSP